MKLRSFGKLFSLIAVLVLVFTLAMAITVTAEAAESDTNGGMTINVETYYKSCGKIKLSWDAVTGASKYVVYIDGENTVNSTANYYIIGNLEVGAKLSVKIVALDESNNIIDFGTLAEVSAEHKYDSVITAPDCTNGGYTTYTCSCGDTYRADEVGATGHTNGTAVKENDNLPTCTVNGSYDMVVYCTVCQAEVSRETTTVDATGHTEGTPVTENNVDPSCTVGGSYDTVVYCTVCQAEVSRETVSVDATGHTEGTPVTENNVDPSCGTPGSYEAVVYCTVCQAEVSRETVSVDATGAHTWTDATCTAPKTCSVCNVTEGSALGHTGGSATCTEAPVCSACGQTYGKANGHSWAGATCEAPKTCSACGTTEGKALGHDYSEATCTTAATCSKCGKKNGSALGHDFTEADCENGSVCLRCDAEGGKALGHSFAPDSDPDAFVVYEICENCGLKGSFSKVQLPEKHKETVIKGGVLIVCALVVILAIRALKQPATTTPWYKRRKYR